LFNFKAQDLHPPTTTSFAIKPSGGSAWAKIFRPQQVTVLFNLKAQMK
jgi:hypothetical protein